MRIASSLTVAALAAFSAPAVAQGLNIDLGPNILFAPEPDPTYGGAVGQAGVWNPVPPSLTPVPLVDLTGGPTGVTLRSDSASSFTVFPSVMPAGNDQRLMEDFQVTPNLNTLVTWTFEGLFDGHYTLYVYASDPTDPQVQVKINVVGVTATPAIVGGGWPGTHVAGVTFTSFNVAVTGGTLSFTAEVVGGPLDSGVVNGIQLAPISARPLGITYCNSNPNSTGVTGNTIVLGSTLIQSDLLILQASSLPPGTFAYFITSRTPGMVPNPGGSQGILCLGGAIGRFSTLVGAANPGGIYTVCTQGCPPSRTFSLGAMPTSQGAVAAQAGETWGFQCWFRDSLPSGASTSNFTSAYQVSFQ